MQAQRQRDEHQAGSERERLALQPYRPPAIDPIPDEWLQARALTLPELKGFQEVAHPYEHDVEFSEAWAVPTQGAAFAVIYKVSATVHDRFGSGMFPMHALRWVLHPVMVDGNICTGWAGEPTVLFRTGSEHALPPSLATMA